jgi:hypothetical protein
MKRVVRISEQDLSKLLSNIIKMSLGGNKLDSSSTDNKINSSDTKTLEDKVPSKTTSDDDFYKKVLECLGAKPTKGNMDFMYAWRQSEGAKADFNPFNTTKNMPGATIYNNAKVKNYKSKEDGIKATCDTLKLSYYNDIVNGLKNDVGLYELSRMRSLKTWGTGELLAKVADGYMGGASPKPNPIDTGIA